MKLLKKQGMNLCFAVIVAVLAAMPLLLQSGVLTASSTILYLGKCIAFAIVAMGLDLIWGYTGILSLGHGLYFALGGYAMAMYLKLQATGGSITDFMHVGGLTELPMIWKPFQTLPGAIVMLFIVPTVVSGLIGYFIFKNRVKGVYFSIISQALTWAAYSIFIAVHEWQCRHHGNPDRARQHPRREKPRQHVPAVLRCAAADGAHLRTLPFSHHAQVRQAACRYPRR